MSASLLGLAWAAKVGDSKTRKLVLMKLVDCCDDEGSNIWPSLATVAEHVGASTQQVRRELKRFCQVGLLRKLSDGGRGTGSTARYEMDIDMLARLRRPDYWQVLEAAALHEPLPAAEDDEDESHAPGAEQGAQNAPGNAQILGDMVSPLHDVTLTSEASRVTSGVTQPLNRTLNEREGVPAHEGAPASECEPLPEAPAARAVTPSFEDLLEAYPHAKGDNRLQLRGAWEALPFEMRRDALDGIPAYLAERKAAGLKSRLSAPAYLAGRCWIGLERQAAERAAKAQAGAVTQIAAWSRDWWLLLLDRVFAGRPAGMWVQFAEAGKALSATSADIAAAGKRIGELRPYLCDGREIEAWRPWLAARGARIPVFSGSFRVFLPAEAPPGGRRDDGDDDVRF